MTGQLSEQQQDVLKSAYADLVGAYQSAIIKDNGGAENGHDWDSHRQTIRDIEVAFPDIIEPVNLDEDNDEESELSCS